MSKTDNTRPIAVVETDSRVKKFLYQGAFPITLTGGINSGAGIAKPIRKQTSRVRRQRERTAMTAALRLVHDPDSIPDIPPTRRSVGWRYFF